MSSFTNSTANFDNLLLQTLMGRLQIRSPPLTASAQHHTILSQSLEDLLFDAVNNISDEDNDDDDDTDSKTQLAKEEAKLEKELVRLILAGNTDSLKPNSDQAITIGEHHICVGFHEEPGSEYRVWEWHGHIMLFDDEEGYMPEYIYGNYFERLRAKPRRGASGSVKDKEEDVEKKDEEKVTNLGLRELIDGGESGGSARILHRNANSGSPSHMKYI